MSSCTDLVGHSSTRLPSRAGVRDCRSQRRAERGRDGDLAAPLTAYSSVDRLLTANERRVLL